MLGGKLMTIIGDEDTVTGFLMGGIGELNKERHPNFFVSQFGPFWNSFIFAQFNSNCSKLLKCLNSHKFSHKSKVMHCQYFITTTSQAVKT